MTAQVRIVHFNESYVKIVCNIDIFKELHERYTFRAENYRFHPKYKAGVWDGYIKMFKYNERLAPKGLVPDIIDYLNDAEYTFELDASFRRYKENIEFSWDSLNLPFKPHDYQEKAIEVCLRKKRQIILSATGSGKSLIVYSLVRALENSTEGKILICVPTISLVEQIYNDFIDYSKDNGWVTEMVCQKSTDTDVKKFNKKVLITTWQSVYRKGEDFFSQFEAVIVDEVHTAAAECLNGILNKSVNAFFRFGLTGTLDDSKTNEMNLKAAIGPATRVSSTSELMDRGILTPLKIVGIVIKHPPEIAKTVYGLSYKDEYNYIVTNTKRNSMIAAMADRCNGNTLVLFRLVEKHGKPLFNKIKETVGNRKQVVMVYGGTEVEQRENVRKICETHDNIVIVASEAIFSTGVNIKNLMNIIFAGPTKSKIKILQSIGRGLRKLEGKEICTVYDIADDFRSGKKSPNTTLNHFLERVKIYTREKFNFTIREVIWTI